MIEVIVDEERTGEEIRDALHELVPAHRVIRLDGHAPSPLPSGVTLPAIRDGDRVIHGQAASVPSFSSSRRSRLPGASSNPTPATSTTTAPCADRSSRAASRDTSNLSPVIVLRVTCFSSGRPSPPGRC